VNYTGSVIIPTSIMTRAVGSEVVLLNLETGTYFGLDPIGAEVWQMLSKGKSMAEIQAAMLTEFSVESATLEKDLAALIEQLREHQLIQF
jgi:hypothetical protein